MLYVSMEIHSRSTNTGRFAKNIHIEISYENVNNLNFRMFVWKFGKVEYKHVTKGNGLRE